jgi:catalase
MESAADLARDLVAAANDIYGTHPRRRALHAKGVWTEGFFTATPEAAKLSSAAHFQAEPTPALVRFSNGSGDPEDHDGKREARGIAVKLRPAEGEETDILGTTSVCFATRTPEEFLELLRLRVPDTETGQPDMEKLGAFLGEHPETVPSVQSVIGVEPPASFATLVYYSPHAFGLTAASGGTTWVRYRWVPEAGEKRIPDDEAKAKPRDYLSDELAERLRARTVAFDLILQLAGEGDSLTDPTEVWPDERETITAGRLELTALIDDPESEDEIDVFDPTRVGNGIELSDDPILHARRQAYSVSAYRRLGQEPPEGEF